MLRLLSHSPHRRSFTLIELATALVIASILAGVAAGMYLDLTRDAKLTEAFTTIQSLRQAMELYWARYNEFPSARNSLYLRPNEKQRQRAHDEIERLLGVEVGGRYWSYTLISYEYYGYIIAQARADTTPEFAPGYLYFMLYRWRGYEREGYWSWTTYINPSQLPQPRLY